MQKQNRNLLAATGLGVLMLVVQVSPSWAESPVCEVMFEAYAEKDPYPSPGAWPGTATISIDGHDYDGTISYEGTGKAHMNKNSWHGFTTNDTQRFNEMSSYALTIGRLWLCAIVVMLHSAIRGMVS